MQGAAITYPVAGSAWTSSWCRAVSKLCGHAVRLRYTSFATFREAASIGI